MFRGKEFHARERLGAGDLSAFFAELQRLGQVSVRAPMQLADDATGLRFGVDLPERIWIKLTSGGTGGKYAWTRQVAASGGTWAAHPSGQTGTTSADPAYETNANASVTLSPNPVVRAWRDPNSRALLFLAGSC